MALDHQKEVKDRGMAEVEEAEELQEEDQVQEQAGKKETVNKKAEPPHG